MALVVKKGPRLRKYISYITVGVISLYVVIGIPLTHAIAVNAPQKMTQNDTRELTATMKLSSKHSTDAAIESPNSDAPISISSDCKSTALPDADLEAARASELQKLSQYEQVCQSGIVDTLSFFTPIPINTTEAASYANEVSERLKEFAKYSLHAVVFLEPTTTDGGVIDMNVYNSGSYDAPLNAYFAAIKAAGVTDQMMGTWVPFPEGNTPVWSSVDPAVFTASVIKTVTYQKKYFPTSRASILLDTLTYPSAKSWDGGRAVSFLPFVQKMPTGLLDSFGLQGFPWISPASQGSVDNGEAQDYLRVDLAAEAAHTLATSTVWVNTGTFGVKYAGQTGDTVTLTPARRSQLLTETIAQLQWLQARGFTVSLHLFAQDKATDGEATDWSYWPTHQAATSSSTVVFKSFVHQLQTIHVPLWLFDTDQ